MKKLIMLSIALLALTACQSSQYSNQPQAHSNIAEWQQTRFAQLDTDKNGFLNLNEFLISTKPWMTKAGYDEIKRVKLTWNKLDRWDKNKDKQITLKEFDKGVKAENKRKKNNT